MGGFGRGCDVEYVVTDTSWWLECGWRDALRVARLKRQRGVSRTLK